MPLTTTWTRSVVSKCGCAFSSLTRPWVAQRVWPMPVVAGASARATAVPARGVGPRLDGVAQVLEVADGPHGLDPVALDEGDPGRVVAAVLQAGQALQEELLDGTPPDVPHDAAHAATVARARVAAGAARGGPGGGPSPPARPRRAGARGRLSPGRARPARRRRRGAAGGRGLVLGRRLDHHADELLGAARAHEDAPAALQRVLLGRLGGAATPGSRHGRVAVADARR